MITRHQLQRLLISGLILTGFALQSNLSVGAEYIVNREDLVPPIIEYVQEQVAQFAPDDEGLSVEVEVVGRAINTYPFADAESLEDLTLKFSSPLEQVFSNRSIVRVTMSDKSGRTRKIGYSVKINVKRPVWVVQNQIRPQQRISKSDLTLEMKDVSRNYAHTVGKEDDMTKYVAKMNLMPGHILDARRLTLPPEVRRNHTVKLQLTNEKGMKITITGTALNDGYIGQSIRIRTNHNRDKIYTATVVDQGLAVARL